MPSAKPQTKLQIGFDPGASLSKVVYSVAGGSPKILTMEPQVLSLPATSIEHQVLTARPEDQAWVKVKNDAERVQVCGFLAREFMAVERIELLKYEQAFYKFLAVVGAIAVKEGLSENRLSVDASVLLPYGEINSRDWLGQRLGKGLKRYYFQKTLIRGRLNSYQCVSEGAGLVCDFRSRYGMDWLSTHKITVLILGYRNLSCMTFERGILQKEHSSTCDLGFVRLIDKIIERTPGQSRSALAKSVAAIGVDIREENPELRSLIRSTQPENVEAEAKMLVEAIKTSRREYWQLVQDWLNSIVPAELDHLAASGGTSIYLKDEIERHFDWVQPEWLSSHVGELSQLDSTMQFRFADVMALFSTFSQKQAA
jgi:hypothetical protein